MAVSRDFWPFFYSMNPIHLGPCWKDCFCRYICEISGSAQANTARSQKIKLAKILNWLTLRRIDSMWANTAQSQTLHWLTLRRVKQIFWLSKISISREAIVHKLNFLKRKKMWNFSKNPKLTNTAQSVNDISENPKVAYTLPGLTLRGVLPALILSAQASPCLETEYKLFFKYM